MIVRRAAAGYKPVADTPRWLVHPAGRALEMGCSELLDIGEIGAVPMAVHHVSPHVYGMDRNSDEFGLATNFSAPSDWAEEKMGQPEFYLESLGVAPER
jgi:hypothetical protein